MEPAAASSYQVSDDRQTYTITLRAGLLWTDGEPVTAHQYVDGFCRLLDPATGNGDAYLLADGGHVTGAAAFASGEAADCSQVGISAPTTRTLVIELAEPVSYLPEVLASKPFMPSRQTAAAESAADGGSGSEREAVIGNGPYVVEEWSPGQRIVLAKNPAYWNAEQVQIGRIELPIVTDATERLKLYKQGELAVAEISPESAATFWRGPASARNCIS